MKILRLFVVLSALFCAVVAPSPARAQGDVSFDFFYDSLAPYGDWVEVGDYGLCWTPTHVAPDWSPYSDGYFAYTDAGWTWVSYEDFGGIVYHYGRWIHLDNGQWCWSPDYQWAPAWVSWRYGHEYVGWAPLPPEARWRRDRGFSVWVDDAYDMGPGRYSFCRVRDFGAPVLGAVIINREENLTIMRGTLNVTNITYNNDYAGGPVIFVGGPSFEVIDEVSARPIPALKLVLDPGFDSARWREHRGPGGRPVFNAHTVGNQLIVAAPVVAPPRDLSTFTSRVKTVIPAKKVNNGWSTVKNPEQFRQEFRQQLKGVTPESAAHPVAAADLKVVPAKGDPHASPIAGGDRREKSGRGQRPESVVAQPNNVPPSGPTAGNPLLKPFNAVTEPGQNPRSQNPPGATFPPNPRGVTSTDPGAGGNNHPRSNDDAQKERAAEQAKIRAEEERISQQKQIPAQQEGAKMQAEENRRREIEKQQQFQQQQIQQQQIQQQHGTDPRKVQEAEREREREHQKPQVETQHAPQPQPQVQQHGGNQPPSPNGSPQPGNKGHSKDSKDKDKDKDKNGN